jgi:molecular chaperone GrpE
MSESNLAENDSPLEDPLHDDNQPPEDVHEFNDPSDALGQAEERVLRAQAELENFRKRARRELEDERRYALVPLVSDLLPVLDNLNLAIGAAEQNEGAAGLLEGVKMVAQQLLGVLEQSDCKTIEDLGEAFDPNLHEAIGQEASSDYEVGVVSRVTRRGYRLHDRVVRPSQVMISTGAPPEEPDPHAEDK